MTQLLATSAAAVNLPSIDVVKAADAFAPKKSRKRGTFWRAGSQWVPNAMRHMSLPYGHRTLSTTLHQLAAHAWSVKGPMHFGWHGLAKRLGKAASTVRIHLERLCALGLLQLVERGGGRILGKCGSLVGKASEYTLTQLGWLVVRDQEAWPLPAKEPEQAPETPPAPDSSDDKQSLGNLPTSGTHLERGGEKLGVLFPLPYPSPESRKEAAAAEEPEASPGLVAAGPDVLNAAAAATPGWLGNPRPAAPRQTHQDGRKSTIPTGRGWGYEAMKTWLLGAGVHPDAVPGAVKAAGAPGVGAPLSLALWWAEKKWPELLAWKARRQAALEDKAREEAAAREKTRRKLAGDGTYLSSERGGCPHGNGWDCQACRDVGVTVARLVASGTFLTEDKK